MLKVTDHQFCLKAHPLMNRLLVNALLYRSVGNVSTRTMRAIQYYLRATQFCVARVSLTSKSLLLLLSQRSLIIHKLRYVLAHSKRCLEVDSFSNSFQRKETQTISF